MLCICSGQKCLLSPITGSSQLGQHLQRHSPAPGAVQLCPVQAGYGNLLVPCGGGDKPISVMSVIILSALLKQA